MKNLIIILIPILLFSCSYSQTNTNNDIELTENHNIECNEFFNGQFVPINQIENDSVFYLFTFSRLYEFHANKEYRNIFDIKWFDNCAFELEFAKTSKPENINYTEGDVIKCYMSVLNDSIIEYIKGDDTIQLKLYRKHDILHLMETRDIELKELFLEKQKMLDDIEEKKQKGDTLNSMLSLFSGNLLNNADKIQFNTAKEDSAINIVFRDLKNYNSSSFYENMSSKSKEKLSFNIINQYFDYLKNVYGKWEYIRMYGKSYNMSLLGVPVEEGGVSNFEFKVKFEKCLEEVNMKLSLSSENDSSILLSEEENKYRIIEGQQTIQSINVISNEYPTSEYLDSLSSDFFALFYKKKYKKIYHKVSDKVKSEITEEQLTNILSLAFSMRDGSDYKIYRHEFIVSPGYGGLITIHYVAETDKNYLLLSLGYIEENKNFNLAGIHIKEIKK